MNRVLFSIMISLVCLAIQPANSASDPAPSTTAVTSAAGTTGRDVDMTCRIEEPDAQELSGDPQLGRYSERLAAEPDDDDAREQRARLYARKGAYTAALADYDIRIGRGGASAEAYNDRCFVRGVLDQLPAAIADCGEALRQHPDFDEALDSRGLAHLKAGQPEQAIADFSAALRLNGNRAATLYARGIAKLQLGADTEAEEDMQAAMKLDGYVGNEIARYGLPDPHPDWGLRGVVSIGDTGEIAIVNGFELPDGHIADSWTHYRPGDARYREVMRHLCGLKPGEHRLFRPW